MIKEPKALSHLSVSARRGIRYVLCDIDDTLTTNGHLTASAYCALEDLSRAGIPVIPVTGRPAGWCDMIARLWPVAGVVGENGAFYFRHDSMQRQVVRRYWYDEKKRRSDYENLTNLARRIVEEVPGAGIASDQSYRESDLAIDWCEDVPRLSDDAVTRVVAIARSVGATAKVSSIHINIWFGEFDKLAMSRELLKEVFEIDIGRDPDACVFIGDSPNDSPMFSFFPLTVGVANILNFLESMEVGPTYVTRQPGGDGFAEFGAAVLSVG